MRSYDRLMKWRPVFGALGVFLFCSGFASAAYWGFQHSRIMETTIGMIASLFLFALWRGFRTLGDLSRNLRASRACLIEIRDGNHEDLTTLRQKYPCVVSDLFVCVYRNLDRLDAKSGTKMFLENARNEGVGRINTIQNVANVLPVLGLFGSIGGLAIGLSALQGGFSSGDQDILKHAFADLFSGVVQLVATTAVGSFGMVVLTLFHGFLLSTLERFMRDVEIVAKLFDYGSLSCSIPTGTIETGIAMEAIDDQ